MDISNKPILTCLKEAYTGHSAEPLLEAMMRILPQVFFIHNVQDQRLHTCTEKNLTSLLGYNSADVGVWNNLLYLVHPDDLANAAEQFARIDGLQDDEQIYFHCRFICKKGEIRHVAVRGTLLTPDRKDRNSVLYLIEDNTEKAELEKKISQLQSVQNNAAELLAYKEMIDEKESFLNQGSWETTLQTGETTWSKGMYHIFGYDTESEKQDLKVTSTLHLSHLTEEERKSHLENWRQALKDKHDYVREASIITQQGEQKQVETYGKIIRNKDGVAEKVIGTTRDVTSLNEYKQSLEEKINELNRRNSDLEGFAYIASHDLQEPLRKLTAFSERLQTKFRQQLGEEGQLYLDRIMASTENMRSLIDSLLEFSRTARSNRLFSKQSLTGLLGETQSDLELKIEESCSHIEASPLPTIDVIPSQIKQLFNNLLGNSIKFKKADQTPVINVSCETLTHPEKKHHNLKTNKEYYKLLVTDNGIGFEKEYAEKIFQIFQRLHGRHEYPGSGIGLAICKKIVENHNGLIYADAEPDKGALFTIILPENQL